MFRNIEYVVAKLSTVINDTNTPDAVLTWAADLAEALTAPLEPPEGFQKGDPLPQSMGGLADHYSDVREARLKVQKMAETIKERETEVYKVILSNLENSADTGASGKHHRVQMVEKEVFNVSDWDALYAQVQQTGAFEMLHKRLSDGAVKDYLEVNGGALPNGVAKKTINTLSFNKV